MSTEGRRLGGQLMIYYFSYFWPWPSKNNTSINLLVNALALWRAVGAAVDTHGTAGASNVCLALVEHRIYTHIYSWHCLSTKKIHVYTNIYKYRVTSLLEHGMHTCYPAPFIHQALLPLIHQLQNVKRLLSINCETSSCCC